jgi:hypothetical protein
VFHIVGSDIGSAIQKKNTWLIFHSNALICITLCQRHRYVKKKQKERLVGFSGYTKGPHRYVIRTLPTYLKHHFD